MNTTAFIINTQTTVLIDQLKTNKVPMINNDGTYLAVVPVCRELDLLDLICEIAEKTEATADITVHYQDGSGLDQSTYSIHFINGKEDVT